MLGSKVLYHSSQSNSPLSHGFALAVFQIGPCVFAQARVMPPA
jgi:hypothetical protein